MIKRLSILKVLCKLKNYFVEIGVQYCVLHMTIWQESITKSSNLIWQSLFIQLQLKFIVSINKLINRDYQILYLK